MPTKAELRRRALAQLDAMIPPDVLRDLAWRRYVEEVRAIPDSRRRG